MTQETTNSTTSLRAVAVAAVPPGLKEHLLAWASENHITTPDDPFWPLAAGLINSLAAARAAGDAAVKVGAAVGSIQDEIFKGTQRAAGDLAAGVARGIEDKTAEAGAALMQTIEIAASQGARELQKAAAGLDKLGQDKGAAFVETWKATLAATVQKQATTALKKATLREWVAAVFGLGVMLCVGVALAVGYGLTTHKILDARGIEIRGRGANTEIIIRRRMVWLHHKYCPPGAACLVTPKGDTP